MGRYLVVALLVCASSGVALAGDKRSSTMSNLKVDCTVSTPGPNQIKTCEGPKGYQAVMHQTPMGEQLTLENTAIAFSAAVIRCERGQRITSLGWRTRAGKPFAALIGYECTGFKSQSTAGAQERILVQGLKGFEEYGHEVRAKTGVPTMAAAERLADSWLEQK